MNPKGSIKEFPEPVWEAVI